MALAPTDLERRSLVRDQARDVIRALCKLRRDFQLPSTKITLTDVSKEQVAQKALDDLLCRAREQTGADIRRVLKIALLTIPLLPTRYRRPPKGVLRSQRRQGRSLSGRIRKWADELEDVWQREERKRRQAALDEGDPTPAALLEGFVQLPESLRQYADYRDEKLFHTRLVDDLGPNLQIRVAVLLSSFVERATGRHLYTQLSRLLDSAFRTSGKESPDWIGRLGLERRREAKRVTRLLMKGNRIVALEGSVLIRPHSLR